LPVDADKQEAMEEEVINRRRWEEKQHKKGSGIL
jgi:hypothetical protein